MRLNKYLALATGMSRRAADDAIAAGSVQINGTQAVLGQSLDPENDQVTYKGKPLAPPAQHLTIMLHKPVGYVCSRDGQGSKTIYDLLPAEYQQLKPVGRLDKDSSGLLLLTNDGTLAYELTHPSFQKQKTYEIRLDHNLTKADFQTITGPGVRLDDGISRLGLDHTNTGNTDWKVTMTEGRNRQIRRTFQALDYTVIKLHRVQFGPYSLDSLAAGKYQPIEKFQE